MTQPGDDSDLQPARRAADDAVEVPDAREPMRPVPARADDPELFIETRVMPTVRPDAVPAPSALADPERTAPQDAEVDDAEAADDEGEPDAVAPAQTEAAVQIAA